MLRILRSPAANFGTVDLPTDALEAREVYSDEELRGLADSGFNAIWVRVIFRELLRNPRYPTFGARSEQLLDSLRSVIRRGARVGIKLIAYCQEPLGMRADDPFWVRHPSVAGVAGTHNYGSDSDPYQMRAFCSSSDEAREYLRRSSAEMLRQLPGLGGIITITASEFMSHCYSHHRSIATAAAAAVDCPRCAGREAVEVVAEILNALRHGMDEVDSSVPLIAWNWSWAMHEPDPQPGIIGRLEPGVSIMAGFERGGVKTDPAGGEITIDEYSLSFAGPSARFRSTAAAATASGHAVYAKLQISATHEIASVSNLPLIPGLFHKARGMRETGVRGFMGCWNFGNRISLNTRAVNFFLSEECPDNEDAALETLAGREFPNAPSPEVVAAWRSFALAFDHHPFSIPFLYYSPINYCLALPFTRRPLHERPIGRSWHMDPRDDRDDPSRCFGPFDPVEIHDRLGRIWDVWEAGRKIYEEALPDNHLELEAARAVGLSVRSIRNYFRLYLLKRDPSRPLPEAKAEEVFRDEIAVVTEALGVYTRDPRQGYHGEAHAHMVTPELLEAKRRIMMESLDSP